MHSSTFAASRTPWLQKSARAASTASCAAIFITQRPARSGECSTSTTEIGLKAAPLSSKIEAESWRFSAGQTNPREAANIPRPLRTKSPPFFPRKESFMTADSAIAAPRIVATKSNARRLLVLTDAWAPQVNGVVRTLETLGKDLSAMGHEVRYGTPEGRFTVPLPTYAEIRLAIFPRASLEHMIDDFRPDAIHIATEGTIGLSARAICLRRHIPFTTSFHTRFPEYVNARFPFISKNLVYRFLRWFHGPATAMMVATPSLKQELEVHGFRNVRIWSRGVDVDLFRPIDDASVPFEKPVFLYVGRVAIEKNIEAFLNLDLP